MTSYPMEKNAHVQTLLSKLKKHDLEHDFKQLYNLLYDRFFRIAVYYLKRDEWAQEVVLDVFLSLWNKRKELAEKDNFDGYCFILLKNTALNYLRKAKKFDANTFEGEINTKSSDITPEDNLMNEELLLVYVRALDDLPPKCREVFILIREQGMNYAQAGEQLNISIKTVDAQLQKAVGRLKEKINQYLSESE